MKREDAIEIIRKNMPSDKSLPIYEALQTLVNETAESEDERIRLFICDLITHIFWGIGWDISKKDCLAYLKKQKDLDKMIVVSPDVWDNAINDAYENGKRDGEKQKEHQNNSDAREKALGRYLTFPLDKDKNLDDIAQDYVDGVKEYNPEPTWDLMQTAVCYGYHYCEQKEQKPVVTHGETYHVDTLGTQQVIAGKMPQKPAEWGEDDEKKINFLSRLIEFQVKDDEYCFGDGRLISKQEAIEMLKSFRPQPKQEWSEEDSKRYISIGTTLETSVVLPKEDYDANMAWLRELVNAKKYSGSRPSWKPTKEQMEALAWYSGNSGVPPTGDKAIKSLYEDLKKL